MTTTLGIRINQARATWEGVAPWAGGHLLQGLDQRSGPAEVLGEEGREFVLTAPVGRWSGS